MKEAFKEKMKRSFVVERGVKVSDLEDSALAFILNIFWDKNWLSLFQPINAYLRLVHDFYANMVNISVSPPHFTTKVLSVKIHVTPTFISQVTQIPIVPNPGFPFSTPDHQVVKSQHQGGNRITLICKLGLILQLGVSGLSMKNQCLLVISLLLCLLT